jgi:DNA-binding LacI/PurR family transcriptional regulator
VGNIREIARLAGVSVTTVSRVLNNHPYVKKEKRDAVIEAVERLNYTKNSNAVHLSKGRTHMIGVMLPYVNHPYFSSILEGIADAALSHSYSLNLFQTNYDFTKELDALEKLKTKQVDGMIITSRSSDVSFLEKFSEEGPIILCENLGEDWHSSVYIDHYQAFLDGLLFLAEKGHTKIGYCLGRLTGTNSQLRIQAFHDGMERLNVKVNEDWVFHQCTFIEDGRRVAHEIFQLKDKPTALLVSSDQVAAGILTQSKKLGIRIPKDLALLSFDNHPLSEGLELSTMDLPVKEMGREAFELFLDDLNGSGQRKQRKLPYHLIRRRSV